VVVAFAIVSCELAASSAEKNAAEVLHRVIIVAAGVKEDPALEFSWCVMQQRFRRCQLYSRHNLAAGL
jgi:hypothetical protein